MNPDAAAWQLRRLVKPFTFFREGLHLFRKRVAYQAFKYDPPLTWRICPVTYVADAK